MSDSAADGTHESHITLCRGARRRPGAAVLTLPVPDSERRARTDRRGRVWWSVLYGSFNPRRRRPPRRQSESRFHSLDWHAAHLLGAAIGILLLSVADALMTVTLLSGGAVEVNPIMAAVVDKGTAVFAAVKMAMTGCGVVFLVVLARYRFMRVVRVDVVMYLVLVTYAALLGYEYWMLQRLADHS
ncbi:MAG: DUF5658 family protein [Pseudomonadota bacterium]|nr:DUF5658 family protein [Pseudomonadota bacterium]